MIRDLVTDREVVAEKERAFFAACEVAGDPADADLAVRRIEVAEESAWTLRGHQEG